MVTGYNDDGVPFNWYAPFVNVCGVFVFSFDGTLAYKIDVL